MRFWRRKNAEAEPGDAGEPGDVLSEAEQKELHEQTEKAVERSRKGLFGRIGGLFERADFDDTLWDDLEDILVASDTGIGTTELILGAIRERVRTEDIKQSSRVQELLREELVRVLRIPTESPPAWTDADGPGPLVVVVVGVNGAGKTTSIAKMAHAFSKDGAKVVLGAADTFRAAATEQLQVWGDRLNVRVVAHQQGGDPGAVAFDTISAAESDGADIVIIDTAGRLHTKTNLMEELKKVRRVIQRKHPDAPHETLLVIDATTGQNGLAQARVFAEAVDVTGIVLAKLDGTAKGGIVFAIADELKLPVRFIGTGEALGDLAPFDADEFVDALLA